MSEQDRRERELKKRLKKLTNFLVLFERALDAAMQQPSTYERGQRIAKLANLLSIENQAALHFGLGYSFKKIEKLYGCHSTKAAQGEPGISDKD